MMVGAEAKPSGAQGKLYSPSPVMGLGSPLLFYLPRLLFAANTNP